MNALSSVLPICDQNPVPELCLEPFSALHFTHFSCLFSRLLEVQLAVVTLAQQSVSLFLFNPNNCCTQ